VIREPLKRVITARRKIERPKFVQRTRVSWSIVSNAMEICDSEYMRLALSAAQHAADKGEVPVGAIIVANGQIVGTGSNCREGQQNPFGHAEIVAIQEAADRRQRWRLEDCDIYVTLEPCLMCTGAILQSRIRRLVFGCLDSKAGAVESLYRLCEDRRLNHQLPVTGGVFARESAALLADFFTRLRLQKRQIKKNGEVAEPV
jgi:tRNA(adenine34) deaminase